MSDTKEPEALSKAGSSNPQESSRSRSPGSEGDNNDVVDSRKDEGSSDSASERSSSKGPTGGSPTKDEEKGGDEAPDSAHGWQAIYSPQHNAYYFYNSITQETTWENPLQLEASGSASAAAGTAVITEEGSGQEAGAGPSTTATTTTEASGHGGPGTMSRYDALQAAALAQGIDPALAYLDPSLLSSVPGRPVDATGIPLFTAKFNRHTGAFAKPDSRDPGHFSEFERAKRMSEFYFDVNQWEQQLAEQGGSIQGEDAGKKRKRLTKTDLERFKEQKKQKKLAKTAWLRS